MLSLLDFQHVVVRETEGGYIIQCHVHLSVCGVCECVSVCVGGGGGREEGISCTFIVLLYIS